MPTLPLPIGGAALHGGDLPASSGSDVLAQFADTHKLPTVAPVRDALNEAIAAIHIAYQDEVALLFAQQDPRLATGDNLLKVASDHNVVPGGVESESSVRGRIFLTTPVVTPQAVVDAVNKILAPYTTIQCQLIEPEMDGLYVNDGVAAIWDGAFINALGSSSTPHYQDRYYADDKLENGGFVLSNNDPGGAIVSQGIPRNFHLRLPELAASDLDFAFVIDSDTEIMAIGNGTDASGAESDGSVATSIFNSAQTSDDIYNQIIGTVESLKGQGIAWSAYVDPYLS